MNFKRWIFFERWISLFHSSFQFSEKISLQNPKEKSQFRKTDLIHGMMYQFCIFDSLDTCFGVSIHRTTVIPHFACHNSAETYDIVNVKSFWKLICSCYFLKKVFCFGRGSWPWGPLFKKICKNLCTIQVGPKNGNF